MHRNCYPDVALQSALSMIKLELNVSLDYHQTTIGGSRKSADQQIQVPGTVRIENGNVVVAGSRSLYSASGYPRGEMPLARPE